MAGRNCADIVFCIDASGSMKPCIDAVRSRIEDLIRGLESNGQTQWDIRYDFLAFQDSDEGFHACYSVNKEGLTLIRTLYKQEDNSAFFTRDLAAFKRSLSQVPVEGEEMQLLGLDIAADFPWRPSSSCHRVVVLLSDEAVETGVFVREQNAHVDELVDKLQDKHIKLFIIAPESEAFYRVSCADRCEYMALDSNKDGLRTVDFSKMLQAIGKSVSVSQSYGGGATDPRPLFGQDKFVECSGEFGEDRT